MANNWDVPNMWLDNTAYIIGGGESLNTTGLSPTKKNAGFIMDKMNEDLSIIKDKRVIGVNDAFLLGSWIDVCWFGDVRWHDWNREALLDFTGLKVCCCPTFGTHKKPGIMAVGRGNKLGLSVDSKIINWNKSSGASAINLAVLFGVKRIVLLGFDMDKISNNNWHNNHDTHLPKTHSANPYVRFLTCFDIISSDAKRLGVEIINCSMISKITQFVKMPLEEAVCLP